MSDSQGDSGPPLLRPIPRRPFDLNLREPTPPEDEYSPSISTSSHVPLALNLERLNSRLLDPRDSSHASSYSYSPNEPSSASISRAQSSLNLTGSTLSGIYSPSTYGKDRFGDMLASPVGTGTGTPTPWGTGAETPAKGLVRDDDPRIYEIQKERAQPPAAKKHRRRSSLHPNAGAKPLSTAQMVLHFGSRGMLMFGLGALYGMLVKTLHDRHRGQGQNHMDSYDARYMAFWGMSGVAMGCLLPWFDGIWERAFGQDEEVVEESESMGAGGEGVEKQPQSCTDWALAIRGIGAFVGIAFAIRKLPWDSTLQVSLTLALVNPVLWFLIDRSLPGFSLSTIVGVFGSAVLMGLQPDMVPSPSGAIHHPSSSTAINNGAYGWEYGVNTSTSSDSVHQQAQVFTLFGGSVTVAQDTVATAIWMMSVLFCCCVCFGNIGRWLALSRSGVTKGRWAERR